MPLLTLADVRIFNDYKAELKTATVKSKAQTLPFRYVREFTFDAGKKPMLLIGKLPATLLADLKKSEATVKVKAQGLCRLINDTLEFEVKKGSLVDSESDKALNVAGIARATKVVVELSDGSAAKQAALDAAALIHRLAPLSARLDKLRDIVPAPPMRELDGIAAHLKRLVAAKSDDKVDSTTTDELLDQFESGIVALEHKNRKAASAQADADETALGSGSAVDDAPRLQRLDAANKKVDAKTAQPKPPAPKPLASNPLFVEAMRLLEIATKMTVAATAWHDNEIATQQDAEAKLPQAKALVDALTLKIDAFKVTVAKLQTDIEAQEKVRDESSKYKPGVAKKANVQIVKDRAAIAKLNAKIDKIEAGKIYVELKTLTGQANKHGSARHGAQTGVDLQARRAATHGASADQSDNPHGISMQRVDAAGAKLTSIKWNKVTVTWQAESGGKRKIINKQEVLKQLADETRSVNTSTSSMFISHVLEKEAVERAIAILKAQCPWTEYKQGDAWRPIEAVKIGLGKPKKLAGWGYAVARNVVAKKVLLDANKVIEDFRNGTIDQDAMLKGLDTSFVSADDGSVPLVKEVRVTIGRIGGEWSSITHFPSKGESYGWDLEGKTVRRSATSAEEVAGAFREA